MEELQIFEVETIANVLRDNSTDILMSVVGFEWDGVVFGPYIYKFQVSRFQGSRPIFTLPCFPVTRYVKRAV